MNVYERLNKLIAYMVDETFPATISNLSKSMKVYEEQIEQDIQFLLTFEMPKGNLLFAPHIKVTELHGEPCYHMAKHVLFPRQKKDHILRILSPKEIKPFPLSDLEAYFFDIVRNLDFDYSNVYYYGSLCNMDVVDLMYLHYGDNIFSHKLPIFHHDVSTTETILLLKKAIQLGATTTIQFQHRTTTFTPQYIKYDINTGDCYILETSDEDHYIEAISIDDIEYLEFDDYNSDSIKIMDEALLLNTHYSDSVSIRPEVLQRIHCIWSFEYDDADELFEQEPVHVKLKLFQEENGLIDVIRRIQKYRPYSTLTGPFSDNTTSDDKETYYYYEDDVLGIRSFKHWIQQFGSSIVVLEPKELAYEIYRELVGFTK